MRTVRHTLPPNSLQETRRCDLPLLPSSCGVRFSPMLIGGEALWFRQHSEEFDASFRVLSEPWGYFQKPAACPAPLWTGVLRHGCTWQQLAFGPSFGVVRTSENIARSWRASEPLSAVRPLGPVGRSRFAARSCGPQWQQQLAGSSPKLVARKAAKARTDKGELFLSVRSELVIPESGKTLGRFLGV